MTTHDPDTNIPPQLPPEGQTPHDLLPAAARLDRLGQHERASAPAGFEDRLFVTTRASLKAPSEGPEPSVAPRVPEADPVLATIGVARSRAPWKLAAAVTLAATGVMAVWLAQKPGSGTGPGPTPTGGPLTSNAPAPLNAAPLNVDDVARELEEFLAASSEFALADTAGDELSITMLDAGGAGGAGPAEGDPFWDADVLGVDANFEESL
jgi:hypothetical protein